MKMTKSSWPVETPQIDIAYIGGKWLSYFFYDKTDIWPLKFGVKRDLWETK